LFTRCGKEGDMGYWSDLLDTIVDGTAEPPPYVRTLGTTRMKRWEPGRVWCEWEVNPALFQDLNALFGGFIAALADEVLGFTTMTILDEDEVFITTDLHVTFHRLIKDGVLYFEGRIVQREKRTAHAEVVIAGQDGTIVAEAFGKEIIRRARRRG
jgi:uncharacterized protein (TIGR00369 family)